MTDPDVDAAGVAATLDRAHRDGTLLDATSIEIGNRDAVTAIGGGRKSQLAIARAIGVVGEHVQQLLIKK